MTIFAIWRGPIKAIEIPRLNDDRRERELRRFHVFYSLMKTRRQVLSPEHVMALNTVSVDFYGKPRIEDAYRSYIKLLERVLPENALNHPRFIKERDDGLFDLIYEIALALGYRYDKREMKDLSYTPQGWVDEEALSKQARALFIKVLAGDSPFPVAEFDKLQRARGKFPPVPVAAE